MLQASGLSVPARLLERVAYQVVQGHAVGGKGKCSMHHVNHQAQGGFRGSQLPAWGAPILANANSPFPFQFIFLILEIKL